MDAHAVAGALKVQGLVQKRVHTLESDNRALYDDLANHMAMAEQVRHSITENERELVALRSWLNVSG